MKSGNLAKLGASALRAEIVSQSRVRIVICAFMGGYYAVFDISNHPLYLAFALYSSALLLIALRASAIRSVLPALTLFLDNSFAIGGLHLTGERGSFLLFFLIHFSFAYGIRYGRSYLVGSLAISCAGVTWLFWRSFPWQGHIHFLLSYLFGMPFISIYVYSLTEKLRRSEASATTNAHRTSQLLIFLAHDIRTPLHQLLGSIKTLQAAMDAPSRASILNSMENLVNLTARMCSGIVAGQSMADSGRYTFDLDTENPSSASLNRNIVAFVEMFRDRIEREGSALRYVLSGRIAPNINIDFTAVERVLLNVISNAVRHCRGGYVELRLQPEPHDDKEIRIEIENAHESAFDGSQLDSAEEAGNSSIFFGTSIGMDSMRDATSISGGAYFFRALNSSTFLSTMNFPVSMCTRPYRIKTIFPVVVISRDNMLRENCRHMLSGAANLYFYSSPELFSSSARSYDGEMAAIFAELSGDTDSASLDEFDEFSDRHGLVVILSASVHDQDIISVKRHQIRIGRDSMRSTWLQALQLSEHLRAPEIRHSEQSDYGIGSLASARILALDDNALNLSLLSAGLSNYGLAIKTTDSLNAAMLELSRTNYDILILDWNIGHITAFEFLKGIQGGALTRSLKILLLTAENIDCKEMGMHFPKNISVRTKPIDNASILFALKGLWLHSENIAIEEIRISAGKLFFCDSYDGMGWSNESISALDDLFGRFLAEIQERVAEIGIDNPALSHDDLVRRLHSIASMCYSIGAYALGDAFKEQQDINPEKLPRHVSKMDSQFARIRDVFSLTKMHLSMFQLSVRARGVSLAGSERRSSVD